MKALNQDLDKKVIFFLLLVVTFSFLAAYFYLKKITPSSLATKAAVLDVRGLAEQSSYIKQEKTVDFNLHKDEGYLFKSESQGFFAVMEFLDQNPEFKPSEEFLRNENVKGVFLAPDQDERERLIPKNFAQNSILIRQENDRYNKFLREKNINLSNEHFFFNQKIKNIPVYGANLIIHLRADSEVYSISGNLVTDETLNKQQITEGKAREIAYEEAKKEASPDLQLKIVGSDRMVLNKKILGLSEDETNYLTVATTVGKASEPIAFLRKYFVDVTSGKVVYAEDLILQALNRQIYDCRGGGCRLSRGEGSAATGSPSIDNPYDIMGETYNYYFGSFGRDSFDDRGGTIRVNVMSPCRNAYWDGTKIGICEDMIAADVLAHEFTHGVTQHTAGLIYQYQSGALNESISDIFGSAIDQNWTMGENTQVGALRSMSNPPSAGDPDRLFSSYYYCGSGDNGGVHVNSGVLNKAFFLMTDGEAFNGCSVSGIGREKSHAVVYRALTTYVSSSDNFRGIYDAILSACGDLYQAGSADCNTVRSALQATEMDQQPSGTQGGARCIGQTRKIPDCTGATPEPTSTPRPTNTPVPTVPGQPTSTPPPTGGPTPTTPPGQPTSTPFPTPTNRPGEPTNTPAPTATPASPTPTITGGTSVTLNLSLRFQGILQKPEDQFNKMTVKVTIAGGELPNPVTQTGQFIADDQGVFRGAVSFEGIKPGRGYRILVKGDKHMQKKVCQAQPSEYYPGGYHCSEGLITIVKGQNYLDFSNIALLVGDLPEQDGIVNSYDTSLVRNLIGATDPDSLGRADLNLDGMVNAQDYSLVIAALSVRYDEE